MFRNYLQSTTGIFFFFFFSLEVGNIPGSVQGEEFQVLLQLLLWLPATRPLVLQVQHSLINVVQTAEPSMGIRDFTPAVFAHF